MFTTIDCSVSVKNDIYSAETANQLDMENDYQGNLEDLIILYFNTKNYTLKSQCLEVLTLKFQICRHLLIRSELYFWQKYRDSDSQIIAKTYNHICKLIDYAGIYMLGLQFPFANLLELKPLTKCDSYSGNPAWTRYYIDKLEPDEHWHDVFLDGIIGFALYYKDKYQGIIGINFDRTGNPVIVQLQTSKKCRLNYKLNVQKFLLKFVVNAFSQTSTPLYLQSAQNNIYRKPEYNSNGHLAPMCKLMKAYNLNAFHSGFIYDTITKNYLLLNN
jgi:hypothetical protein